MSEFYLRHVSILLDTFSKWTHFALLHNTWWCYTFDTLASPNEIYFYYVTLLYSIWGEMLMTHWWGVSSHIRPIDLSLSHIFTNYEHYEHHSLCDYMELWKIYSKLSVWILEIYNQVNGDGIYTQLLHIECKLLDQRVFLWTKYTFNWNISTYMGTWWTERLKYWPLDVCLWFI